MTLSSTLETRFWAHRKLGIRCHKEKEVGQRVNVDLGRGDVQGLGGNLNKNGYNILSNYDDNVTD